MIVDAFFIRKNMMKLRLVTKEIMKKKLIDHALKFEEKGGQMYMCNALEELVNEGIQKGRLEGIQAIVRTCKRLNLDEKHTVDNIMQEFPISEEEATAYVKKYWSD